MKEEKKRALSPLCLGLAIGVVWGLATFITGLCAMIGMGEMMVSTMGSMYLGFNATFWGSVVGAIWGFIDGFIGGFLVAFFYNLFCSKKA